MELSPIVIFCYNRLDHLKKTINALSENILAIESELFIFSDSSKNDLEDTEKVREVRSYLNQIKGFKKIVVKESSSNEGLAKSVILGVSQMFEQYEKLIIMEDDLVCTKDYLMFMNQGLNKYQDNKMIGSISGFTYPFQIPSNYQYEIFLANRASSWGWGTWKDRWEQTDWEVKDYPSFIKSDVEKKSFIKGGADLLPMLIKQQRGIINSWAVRWSFQHYRSKSYCLQPISSKINHIGNDGTGTNEHSLKGVLLSNRLIAMNDSIEPDETIIQNLYNSFKPSIIRRAINWWKFGINPLSLV